MEAAFPGLSFVESHEAIVEPETIHYLWDISEDIFDVYKICKDYIDENYSLNTTVVVELIKDGQYNMTYMLKSIPYIHSGYTKVLSEYIKKKLDKNKPSTGTP